MFPGQGAQVVGMGLELARTHQAAREVFETADRVLGFSLSSLCFHGPASDLNLTENTQPALVTAAVAAAAVLNEAGISPAAVAGLSLGEYAALVAAGSLDFSDAVILVRNRGRYMQECVPAGKGAMAAIIGLPGERVRDLCGLVSQDDDWVEAANYNSPGQVVVSGHTGAVERACQMAPTLGAKKAVKLPVSAPFHCRLLAEAGRRLAQDIERITVRPARVPLVTNATATALTRPADIVDAVISGISRPIMWEDCVRSLADLDMDLWAEVGPGTVLAGTVKRIVPGTVVHSAGCPDGIESVVRLAGRI